MRSFRPLASTAVLAGLVAIACSANESPTGPTARAAVGDLGALSPTLHFLACPITSGGFAQGVIGPAGGTLRSGGFVASFPAGAVQAPQAFTLTVVPGTIVDVEVRAVGYASYTFAAPVQLTADLSTCGTLPSSARAYYFDPSTRTLLHDMGGVLDHTRRTLTFQTPHFSGYTVVWGVAPDSTTSSSRASARADTASVPAPVSGSATAR